MNKVIMMGRLVRDPEMTTKKSKAKKGEKMSITKFSIAVARQGKKDEADFINCTAFGNTALFINKYFHKGFRVLVEGRLNVNLYEDEDGSKKSYTSVLVDSVEFADSLRDTDEDDEDEAPKKKSKAKKSSKKSRKVEEDDEDDEDEEDDDLPF